MKIQLRLNKKKHAYVLEASNEYDTLEDLVEDLNNIILEKEIITFSNNIAENSVLKNLPNGLFVKSYEDADDFYDEVFWD